MKGMIKMDKFRNLLLIVLGMILSSYGWLYFCLFFEVVGWFFMLGVFGLAALGTLMIMLFAVPEELQEITWKKLSMKWNEIMKPKGD